MPTEKSQNTRLVDVFLLGPFMLWFAVGVKDRTRQGLLPRSALATAAVMTMWYNWQNYRHVDDPSVSSEASDSEFAVYTAGVFAFAYLYALA